MPRKVDDYNPLDDLDPAGLDTSDAKLLARWLRWQEMPIRGLEDPADRMLFDLAMVSLGLRYVIGRSPAPDPETGKHFVSFAAFPDVPHYRSGTPERDAQEAAWERKTLAMMESQGVVDLPDKPLNRDGLRPRGSAVATFERTTAPVEEIPAFHESVVST